MSRRACISAVLLSLVTVLAVTAVAGAATGSGSSGGAGLTPLVSSSTSRLALEAADVVASATGDGVTIASRISALLGGEMTFSGEIAPAAAGRQVVIERLSPRSGLRWIATATAVTASDGSFRAVWRASQDGPLAIRAIVEGGEQTSPALIVTVYRPSLATLYGPGFWGQRTACGQVLHRTTVGVASRTLKCGTLVAIYYGGHAVVVPVIDRGPYANNARWDLTIATAQVLGITGTSRIGALPRSAWIS